jgi:hypothetical protein
MTCLYLNGCYEFRGGVGGWCEGYVGRFIRSRASTQSRGRAYSDGCVARFNKSRASTLLHGRQSVGDHWMRCGMCAATTGGMTDGNACLHASNRVQARSYMNGDPSRATPRSRGRAYSYGWVVGSTRSRASTLLQGWGPIACSTLLGTCGTLQPQSLYPSF